jgi:hypothetical protein
MKQHQAVIEAMRQMGGYATLAQLYHVAVRVPGCEWKTKTPFASIRRIVQTNPEFFRIRPGLWALVSERARVLEELGVSERPTAKTQDFDHSYYQGLIVEVGNSKGCQTFVPNQDKNKPFLRHKLSEIATLQDYCGFTYDHLVRRARTVDVTWFNERRLPKAFFEVEHTTDIQNSLLKFLEFQDFRISYFVVADKARRAEFESKIHYSAFTPVRSDVQFLDYETLSELHSKVSEAASLEKRLRL